MKFEYKYFLKLKLYFNQIQIIDFYNLHVIL